MSDDNRHDRIMVFGHRGYFGDQFYRSIDDCLIGFGDISDVKNVVSELDRKSPTVVINCAGRCGYPTVDWCEHNIEETYVSNVAGPLILAQECKRRGVFFVHLSSGCVYNNETLSETPFSESDPPNFFGSVYSRSKLHCEHLLSEYGVLQLRARMPFDSSSHPRNLLVKLLRYTNVVDSKNSMTYVPEFVEIALDLARNRETGVYNLVCRGAISPYELMVIAKKMIIHKKEVIPVSSDELDSMLVAKRSNCTLSTNKIESAGYDISEIRPTILFALENLLLENDHFAKV